MDDEIRLRVIRRGAAVDEHQLMPGIVIQKSRRGVHGQRRTADDEHLRLADIADGLGQNVLVQTFLVKHDVRPDDAAAVTVRHAGAVVDTLRRIRPAAAHTVAAVDAAVQLEHILAPGRLMQPVDILRDDGLQLPLALQPGKAQMRTVGLGAVHDELVPMEFIVFFRMRHEKRVAQDRLGRIVILLVIEAVHTAKIRNAALG